MPKAISLIKPVIFVIILLTIIGSQNGHAQIAKADRKILEQKEDSLRSLALTIREDSFPAHRIRTDSIMTRMLVRSLQVKNSFYYPYDSLQGVSKLYAPDSSFRIITWDLPITEYWSLKRGAIQMKTADGSLKLIGLHDVSSLTDNTDDSVRTKINWVGAVYYDIVKTTFQGKNFYTLIGFDANNPMSNKKRIEVLSFDNAGEPVFGAAKFFSYEKDSARREPGYRFSLEYKKKARAILKYDPELKLILVDHLISETDEPDNKWTYVPDGDYEAFTWQNGKWLHIDKLYNFKLKEGEAPVGDPLMDPKGNKNEEKLQQQSDKNKQKKKDGGNE